ncbi:MAG: DUF5655 domain-containing protein [bacterium]
MKEAQTRATIIDPILEALGWDVRDPDEVELEHQTVDGKAVDYGLKINRKPVLLIEAKPLNDALDDVKAITQIVGYAANAGIASCILANGVKWRVYRSMEKCAAPDKLMFEVSLDPRESEGLSAQQLAEQMWRFSREEMAKGTLDAMGEQIFVDGNVRKALDEILQNPPRLLLKAIKEAANDESLTPLKIKESLARIWTRSTGEPLRQLPASAESLDQRRSEAATKAKKIGKGKRKKGIEYNESIHIAGRPREVIELYRAIERFCYSLSPDAVEKQCLRRYVNFLRRKEIFCSMVVWKNKLGIYLKLRYSRLAKPPHFARDVSDVGHWGIGDVELSINSLSQVEEAKELIRRSFESIA